MPSVVILSVPCFIVILLLPFLLFSIAKSRLVAAYVVPHGDIVLNPSDYKAKYGSASRIFESSSALHAAYETFGEHLVSRHVDVVVILTPHGMALKVPFVRYGNTIGSGEVETSIGGRTFAVTNVTMVCDKVQEQIVHRFVQSYGVNLHTVVGSSEEMPFPLQWGIVIPLWFVAKKEQLENGPKFVSFAWPRRRLTKGGLPMTHELLTFGNASYDVFNHLKDAEGKKELNVAIVVSGDLSHCHKNDYGPNPYPVRPHVAQTYDSAIHEWIRTAQRDRLMQDATDVAELALSCGYTEFLWLQGVLDQAKEKGRKVSSEVFQAPLAPTYFGMMLGMFELN